MIKSKELRELKRGIKTERNVHRQKNSGAFGKCVAFGDQDTDFTLQ